MNEPLFGSLFYGIFGGQMPMTPNPAAATPEQLEAFARMQQNDPRAEEREKEYWRKHWERAGTEEHEISGTKK